MNNYSLIERLNLREQLRDHQPYHLPVIVSYHNDEFRLLLGSTTTVSQLIIKLRERIRGDPHITYYLLQHNHVLPPYMLISHLTTAEDGFYYITLSAQDAFGGMINADYSSYCSNLALSMDSNERVCVLPSSIVTTGKCGIIANLSLGGIQYLV